jgi:hypothetical protein
VADLDVLHGRIALSRATGRPVTMSAEEAEGYEWWLWHLTRDRAYWTDRYYGRRWARFLVWLHVPRDIKNALAPP